MASPLGHLGQADMAALFGVSKTTIGNWIGDGMPVVTKGGRGVAWEIDPTAAIKWRQEQLLGRKENETPFDRKLTIEAERLQIKLDEDRKQIIHIVDSGESTIEILKMVGEALDGLMRNLERKYGYSPEQIEVLEGGLDQARNEMADEIEKQTKVLNNIAIEQQKEKAKADA